MCVRPGPGGMSGFCMTLGKPNVSGLYEYEPMLILVKPNESTLKSFDIFYLFAQSNGFRFALKHARV